MPDTHATRFTDTTRLIPDKVPIPLATIDDHLCTTSDHLIKLLTNKFKPIRPFVKPTIICIEPRWPGRGKNTTPCGLYFFRGPGHHGSIICISTWLCTV